MKEYQRYLNSLSSFKHGSFPGFLWKYLRFSSGEKQIEENDEKTKIGKEGNKCWLEFEAVTEDDFSTPVVLVVDGVRHEAKIEKEEEEIKESPSPKEPAPAEEPKTEEKKSLNPAVKPIDPETGEEIDIDLDDPQTQKAATKIQVTFFSCISSTLAHGLCEDLGPLNRFYGKQYS